MTSSSGLKRNCAILRLFDINKTLRNVYCNQKKRDSVPSKISIVLVATAGVMEPSVLVGVRNSPLFCDKPDENGQEAKEITPLLSTEVREMNETFLSCFGRIMKSAFANMMLLIYKDGRLYLTSEDSDVVADCITDGNIYMHDDHWIVPIFVSGKWAHALIDDYACTKCAKQKRTFCSAYNGVQLKFKTIEEMDNDPNAPNVTVGEKLRICYPDAFHAYYVLDNMLDDYTSICCRGGKKGAERATAEIEPYQELNDFMAVDSLYLHEFMKDGRVEREFGAESEVLVAQTKFDKHCVPYLPVVNESNNDYFTDEKYMVLLILKAVSDNTFAKYQLEQLNKEEPKETKVSNDDDNDDYVARLAPGTVEFADD